MHLLDALDIYHMKTRNFPKCKRLYEEIKFDDLVSYVKRIRVEYLYHYVAYQSLIVSLSPNFVLDLRTDHVEYIWKI